MNTLRELTDKLHDEALGSYALSVRDIRYRAGTRGWTDHAIKRLLWAALAVLGSPYHQLPNDIDEWPAGALAWLASLGEALAAPELPRNKIMERLGKLHRVFYASAPGDECRDKPLSALIYAYDEWEQSRTPELPQNDGSNLDRFESYKAFQLKQGKVYETDRGQKVIGDGCRYGVFHNGLIMTSLKPDAPNLGMPMPEIYSNGVYAAKVVERYIERAAQRQEDFVAHRVEQTKGLLG